MTARPTSALRDSGSTRRWRKIRKAALVRDRYRCLMTRDGRVCGRRATTAQHVIPRSAGGTDDLVNVVAACVPCNMGEGAAIANANRARRGRLGLARSW